MNFQTKKKIKISIIYSHERFLTELTAEAICHNSRATTDFSLKITHFLAKTQTINTFNLIIFVILT